MTELTTPVVTLLRGAKEVGEPNLVTIRHDASSSREIEALFRGGTCAGLSDGELLDRFQGRRDATAERAFSALVERHWPMVLRTCRAILGDADDAQDAFQVTFLVLARKARSIRRRASVTGWLHGVACRTACYSRGSFARRRRHERAAAAGRMEAVFDRTPDDVAAVLHEEVGRLPERLRTAVLLCEFEGLSGEEAAARLKCPTGTVKSRLSRAKERLRRKLIGRGLGEDYAPFAAAPALVPHRLIETTVAGVSARSTAGTNLLISAALAAWETGVLWELTMLKLKIAASLLAIAFVTLGTVFLVLGQSSGKEKAKQGVEAKKASAQSEPRDDELVSVLGRARIDVAQELMQQMYRLYVAGEIDLESYLRAQKRYQDSILELVDDSVNRLRALRAEFQGATRLEEHVKELVEKGNARQTDLALAKYYRLEAALRLAEATTGKKASLKPPLDAQQYDPARVKALLDTLGSVQTIERLREMLEKRVKFDFPEPTPLSTIIKAMKGVTHERPFESGLPIYVDPEGLKKAKVEIDKPVTLPGFSGPLKEALTIVLEPLGLSYMLRDGLVWITSR